MGRLRGILAAIAVLLLAAACAAPADEPASRQFLAMDTVITFQVYDGASSFSGGEAEIRRLESLLSRTDPDSAVSRLNGSGGRPVEAGEEVCRLLEAAGNWSAASGGAFDITIAPVMDAWGFTQETQQVPQEAVLAERLSRVGMEHIRPEGDGVTVRLDEGTEIDLGGIAKGYAADCLWSLFREAGSSRGWVSLGGNVLAWGLRPDGTPWRIGIQDPRYPDQQRFVGVLGLEDGFAVTSGGYQRYFEQNGVRYHHILNPDGGYPADSGLVSVTVTAPAAAAEPRTPGSGTMCDALSTALFIMGEEKALEFWRQSGGEFQLILVTEDNRVVTTSGLEGQFTPEEGSGYVYETVS